MVQRGTIDLWSAFFAVIGLGLLFLAPKVANLTSTVAVCRAMWWYADFDNIGGLKSEHR